MKVRLLSLLLLILVALPTSAHHSTAMYNMNTPVTVTGVVKRFEWTNPHAFVFLEVKDEKGNTVEWEVEMMSLNHLRGYGWTRDTVKPGDVISCTGGAAKSGAPSMISSYMKLTDGRMMKS
jgi:DNA/RNA endonuclease YhcR with UshA esterase domain